MKESSLTKKVAELFRKAGAWVHKAHGSIYGYAGTPDLLICFNGGQFIAIEVKVGNNKPTPLQTVQLAKIQSAGGLAVVIRSVAEAEQLLGTLKKVKRDQQTLDDLRGTG